MFMVLKQRNMTCKCPEEGWSKVLKKQERSHCGT